MMNNTCKLYIFEQYKLELKRFLTYIILFGIFITFFPTKTYAEADICISNTLNELTTPNIPKLKDIMKQSQKMKDMMCNGLSKNFFVYRKGITIKGLNNIQDLNITVADNDIKMIFNKPDQMFSGVELNGTSEDPNYPAPNGDPINKGVDKSLSFDNPDKFCHYKISLEGLIPIPREFNPTTMCSEDTCVRDHYYRASKVDDIELGDIIPLMSDILDRTPIPRGVPSPVNMSGKSDGFLYNMPSIIKDNTYNLNRWFSGHNALLNVGQDLLNNWFRFWKNQIVYGSYVKDGKVYKNVIINPCGDIPSVSINDAQASPGETMRFRVDISGKLSGDFNNAYKGYAYIHYHTEDGNATAGIDYQEKNATFRISNDMKETYIEIPILPTARVNTQFYVILDNAIGADIVDNNATGTIVFGGSTYLTGPFEAWDTFRGDTNGNGKLNDFNISTKIASKDFNLTIGSLDANSTAVELKPNIDARYSLWHIEDDGSVSRDSDINIFDANKSTSTIHTFTIKKAYRKMFVYIEYCAKQNQMEWRHSFLKLYPYNECSGVAQKEGDISNTNVNKKLLRYHKSDIFAIRPKYFEIQKPKKLDTELLIAGKRYTLTMQAMDEEETATTNYNQTQKHLTIKPKILNKLGDIDNSLYGRVKFGNRNFYFKDGISTNRKGKHNVVPLRFSDVGRTYITIKDKNWAIVDRDDTPQSCEKGKLGYVDVPYGAFICGEQNATFIPDHFVLSNIKLTNRAKDQNFTYLSSDLNMSAHIGLTIKAVNVKNRVTRNFRHGNTVYYENPVKINIAIPIKDIHGNRIHDIKENNLTTIEHNISKALLGFGTKSNYGTHIIKWDETNSTQQLMFNYNRDASTPVHPFDINGSDINISVISVYTSTKGNRAYVKGLSQIANQKATFVYARIKSFRDAYETNNSSIRTPIKIEVYCDEKFPTRDNCPGVDVLDGVTDNSQWFISTAHDMTSQDGNILLAIDNKGNLDNNTPSININNEHKGIDNNIIVSNRTGAVPSTTLISVKPTNNATNSWLIYDPDHILDTQETLPLYTVEFIGSANNNTWNGVGETGKVVGTDANDRTYNRLNW